MPIEKLIASFQVPPTPVAYTANYNIAPTDLAPIIIESEGARSLLLAKFGIPMQIGAKAFPLINIQSEKASGRIDFMERRCIIPATGFFEWVKVTPKERQPYFFRPANDEYFSLAGIWKKAGDGFAFSILTTQANEVVSPIHARMPVILGHNTLGTWLGTHTAKEELETLLGPFSGNLMSVAQVSKAVNNARTKDASCINSL